MAALIVDLKNFQNYSKIKNVFDFFFSAMALQIMNLLSKSCDLKVRKDVFDQNLQNVSQLSSKLFEIFLRDVARVFLAKFLQTSSTEIPFSLLLFNTCSSLKVFALLVQRKLIFISNELSCQLKFLVF
jgi:hypothetical protein